MRRALQIARAVAVAALKELLAQLDPPPAPAAPVASPGTTSPAQPAAGTSTGSGPARFPTADNRFQEWLEYQRELRERGAPSHMLDPDYDHVINATPYGRNLMAGNGVGAEGDSWQ